MGLKVPREMAGAAWDADLSLREQLAPLHALMSGDGLGPATVRLSAGGYLLNGEQAQRVRADEGAGGGWLGGDGEGVAPWFSWLRSLSLG